MRDCMVILTAGGGVLGDEHDKVIALDVHTIVGGALIHLSLLVHKVVVIHLVQGNAVFSICNVAWGL